MYQLRGYQQQFLQSVKDNLEQGCARQLAVLPTASGKCLAKGTPVLMYDGTIRPVEEIEIDDVLMGPDSKPRRVLDLASGEEEMFRVTPKKGDSYEVNKSHILSLKMTGGTKHSCGKRYPDGIIVDMSVENYLNATKTFRHCAKGYRVGVDFEERPVPLDPYILGVWLGDGHSRVSAITNVDSVVVNSWVDFSKNFDVGIRIESDNRAPTYFLSAPAGKRNPVTQLLRYLNVLNNKHVPHLYKANSKETRLQLLAGLIDTDGSLSHKGYDFIQKRKGLSEDVVYLARSVGLAAYMSRCEKYCQTGGGGTYWRVSISGDTDMIPCRVVRKQSPAREQKKDVLSVGIKVFPIGAGRYYGFRIDGDGRFLLGDFTVTHNTVCAAALPEFLSMPSVLFLAHRQELISQAQEQFKRANPSYNIGIEKADFSADDDNNVVIASIPTLGRASSVKRLQRFAPDRFDIVIQDEAHHSTSKSYLQVLRHFTPKLLLGITATPMRGDGIPLANVYDRISFIRTIPDLIHEGEADAEQGPYLSRLRGLRVKSTVDLRNISIRAGEFAEGELADAVNVDGRNSMIISAIEQHLEDRKSILIFATNKAHVEALCHQLNDRGHSAIFVVDSTKPALRQQNIQDFKNGTVRFFVNCGIATEGVDIPNIDAVVMARPVLSPVLYCQMIGRAMRVHPGKTDAVVMDVVDTVGKVNVKTIGDMFGVRGCDFLGEDVYEKAQVVQRAQELGVQIEIDDTIEIVERKADVLAQVMKGTIVIQTRAQLIDVLSVAQIATEVQNSSMFPWVKISDSSYLLPMPDKTISELSCDVLGNWQFKKGDVRQELETPHNDAPFRWADKWIKRLYELPMWKMKRMDAKWRQAPASPKQIQFLQRKYRVQIIPEGFTKGSASDMFDMFNMQRSRIAAEEQ